MRKEADGLRERAGEPGLWEDQEQAQAVTRRLSYLDGELARLEGLHRRLEDTKTMFELADSYHDEAAREEASRDLAYLRKEIDQLEIRTLLSGEYDAREALITARTRAASGRLMKKIRRQDTTATSGPATGSSAAPPRRRCLVRTPRHLACPTMA